MKLDHVFGNADPGLNHMGFTTPDRGVGMTRHSLQVSDDFWNIQGNDRSPKKTPAQWRGSSVDLAIRT